DARPAHRARALRRGERGHHPPPVRRAAARGGVGEPAPVGRRRHARGARLTDGMGDRVWVSDEQHTVPSLLERRLEADPDGEYLDVTGTKLTAADVEVTANRLANALAELGVRSGDRVATLIENSPDALLAWWGAIRGGFVAVPVNTAYKGEYLRHQLADSGSRVLFVEPDLADRATAVAPQVEGLEHVVVSGDVTPSISGVSV